jgi:exonuclease I
VIERYPEYRTHASRSIGFVYLLLGESESQNACNQFAELSKQSKAALDLPFKNTRISEYLSQFTASQTQGSNLAEDSCRFSPFSRDDLAEDLDIIFPMLPVYTCSQQPVLAIAEQAESDVRRRLCR